MIIKKQIKVPGMPDETYFESNPIVADIKFKPGDIIKFKCLITKEEFLAVVLEEPTNDTIALGLAFFIVFQPEIQQRLKNGEFDHDFTDGRSPIHIQSVSKFYHTAKIYGLKYAQQLQEEMQIIDGMFNDELD